MSKWILFVFFSTGAAPITPEHYYAISAEFDDRAACEAVLDGLKNWRRHNPNGFCAPKSSAGLKPEMRDRFEKLWPPKPAAAPEKKPE
jgi:hypothetical protein